MLPDIDLRLKAITKTLLEIVLPELPEEAQQARDHVMLITQHFALIETQWKGALKFELGSYDLLCDLARTLLPLANDDVLRTTLNESLDAATALDRTDYDSVNQEVCRLGRMVDRVISGDFTTEPMDPVLLEAVLDYSAREAKRVRVWFAAYGADPEAASLSDT